MMTARKFIQEDLAQVNRWHALHEMPVIGYDDLPEIGFIVPGVCAGFLYQTDSSVCMLDGYISNPESEKNARKDALDAITFLLITTAKDLMFTTIMAFTKNQSVMGRCERYEFTKKGEYNLFVRRI